MVYRILDMSGWTQANELFKQYSDIVTVDILEPTRKNLLEHISKYDGYIATLKTRIDREVMDRAIKLKAIFTPTTGMDHIDIEYATQKGIPVFGTKYDREMLDRITSTAELALTLLLAVVRRLPWAFQSAMQGKWSRDAFRGMQLSGKTLGILGYGRLGTMMARYGLALGMKVIACDVSSFSAPGVECVSHEELYRRSDVLSIHIHLNEYTKHIINAEVLSKMKDGVILINTSRGAIIDEQALLGALKSGKIGGFGADVIDGEWRTDLYNHPLIKYANEHDTVVITPHTGGTCYEAQNITAEGVMKKIGEFYRSNCTVTENLKKSKVN